MITSIYEMSLPESVENLFTVVYALLSLLGASIIAYTAFNAKKRMDDSLVRARAFLDKSFMENNWKLLFLICVLFLFNSIMKLNEEFDLLIDGDQIEILEELTELIIVGSIALLTYIWYRLLNPKEDSDLDEK